jgi:hypothetical protein
MTATEFVNRTSPLGALDRPPLRGSQRELRHPADGIVAAVVDAAETVVDLVMRLGLTPVTVH